MNKVKLFNENFRKPFNHLAVSQVVTPNKNITSSQFQTRSYISVIYAPFKAILIVRIRSKIHLYLYTINADYCPLMPFIFVNLILTQLTTQ